MNLGGTVQLLAEEILHQQGREEGGGDMWVPMWVPWAQEQTDLPWLGLAQTSPCHLFTLLPV